MDTALSLLTSFLYAFSSYFITSIIYHKKINISKNVILILLIYSLIFYITIFLVKSSLSTFLTFFTLIPFFRMLFGKNKLLHIVLALIIYTTYEIIQILFLFLANDTTLMVTKIETYNINKFYLNVLSYAGCVAILYILKDKVNKTIHKIVTIKYYDVILCLVLIIDLILSFISRYRYTSIEMFTITDFIVFAISIVAIIYSTDRSYKLDSVSEDYNEVTRYSKLNEELNINYRKKVHENKNQLLIIRGMINGKRRDLEEYVDCLLDDHNEKVDNYWLSDLSHIPLPGVKNFLNCKLAKLKKIGANIEIFVSNELESICLDDLGKTNFKDFSTVLGVVLDNMIDCIKEQEEKLISINFFVENNEIHGEFVNNFNGNIDLDKLFNKDYSTKGKNRGVGLSLVNHIISNNDFIDCKPKIIDNFFVQDVTLKLEKLPNYQKS